MAWPTGLVILTSQTCNLVPYNHFMILQINPKMSMVFISLAFVCKSKLYHINKMD